MALSQSLPTPKTKEPPRVVTSLAVGAPGLAFPEAIAPMAPEPFVPEVSTPVKLITVIEETTFCDSVAVTVTALNGEAERARQISAVPDWTFVLSTRTQVSPAPVTLVTVVLDKETLSAEINASRSSLAEVVEKADVLTVVLAVPWSFDTVASIPMAPNKG
jgi:hypothetical protein